MRNLVIALAVLIGAPFAASLPTSAQAAEQEANSIIKEIRASAAMAEGDNAGVESAAGYDQYRIEEEKSRRVLILALIVAAIASLLIVLWFLKTIGTREASTMVNASGLVLVVYATVLVVMIGKTDQQLMAAIGILGAIAGYLFGTATKAGAGGEKGGEHKP